MKKLKKAYRIRPKKYLKNTEAYIALGPEATKLIDSLWTDLMSEIGKNPWYTPVLITVSVALIIFINLRRIRKKKMKEL